MHAATGAIIGYSLARWMFVRQSQARIWKGWAVTVVLHGSFNFLWLYAGVHGYTGGSSWLISEGFPILAIFILVVLGGWILGTIRRLRSQQLIAAAAGEPITEPPRPYYLQQLQERTADKAGDSGNRLNKD